MKTTQSYPAVSHWPPLVSDDRRHGLAQLNAEQAAVVAQQNGWFQTIDAKMTPFGHAILKVTVVYCFLTGEQRKIAAIWWPDQPKQEHVLAVMTEMVPCQERITGN